VMRPIATPIKTQTAICPIVISDGSHRILRFSLAAPMLQFVVVIGSN
jgi:hypothetical protein